MSEQKRPRVMVDMSATLIHHGHIRLLKKASEIGDVVVALTTDDEIKRTKGYTPELNFEERKEILEAIKYVKEVVPSPWLISYEYMKEQKCDFLVHGHDNSNHIPQEKLVIFPRTEGISSSILRERVLDSLIEMNTDSKPSKASDKVRNLFERMRNYFMS